MAKTYGLMRLGRDAEVRRTPAGEAVCNLSLAYNYGQKDDKGERPTQWVDASLWGKQAESLAPYLTKGSLHLFTLRDIHMEQYTDKEGYAAFKLAATVVDVELGPKQDGAPKAGPQGDGSAPMRRPAAGAAPAPRSASAPSPSSPATSGLADDDIPF